MVGDCVGTAVDGFAVGVRLGASVGAGAGTAWGVIGRRGLLGAFPAHVIVFHC